MTTSTLWKDTLALYTNKDDPERHAMYHLIASPHALADILRSLPSEYSLYGLIIAQQRHHNHPLTQNDYASLVEHSLHHAFIYDVNSVEQLQKMVPIHDTLWHEQAVRIHPHLSRRYLLSSWEEQHQLRALDETSPVQHGLKHIRMFMSIFVAASPEIIQTIPVDDMRNIFFQLKNTEYMTQAFIQKCECHTAFMAVLSRIKIPITLAVLFTQKMAVEKKELRNIQELITYKDILARDPSYLHAFYGLHRLYLLAPAFSILQELVQIIPKPIFESWIDNKRIYIETPLSWLPKEFIPERFKDEARFLKKNTMIPELLPWFQELYLLDMLAPNDDYYILKTNTSFAILPTHFLLSLFPKTSIEEEILHL